MVPAMSPSNTPRQQNPAVRGRLLVGIIAASVISATGATAHADTIVDNTVSGNWSGYAVVGSTGTFTQASGSWVVPTVASVHAQTNVSIWVGIDGANNSTVEQLGISAVTANNGNVTYYAWYEFYIASNAPAGFDIFEQPINSITVHPGDTISASVLYTGSTVVSGQTQDNYTLSLTDGSQNFSINGYTVGDQRSSAEWIAEAPSSISGGGVVTEDTLANFGAVTFSNAVVNNQLMTAYNYTGINMVSVNANATAGPLNGTANGFTVTYVPEPASVSVLVIAGGLLVRRRRPIA